MVENSGLEVKGSAEGVQGLRSRVQRSILRI